MPNMSYCRFRNTNGDLRECVEALQEGKKLSPDEAKAAERMAQLCQHYLDAYEENGVHIETYDD